VHRKLEAILILNSAFPTHLTDMTAVIACPEMEFMKGSTIEVSGHNF
jgi:hypothetical protein